MNTDNDNFAERLINNINYECSPGKFIYRGTNKVFDKSGLVLHDDNDRVSTGIYRTYNVLHNVRYSAVNIEKEIVSRFKQHFKKDCKNIEILTDIRHFGGLTNLIDFSNSLLVALFFACTGRFDHCGEIITLRKGVFPKLDDIEYASKTHKIGIIKPCKTKRNRSRILAQESVFVHAPQGYIPITLVSYKIPANKKPACLKFLRDIHVINENYIFNDFSGYLKYVSNNKSAMAEYYKGLHFKDRRRFPEAISNFEQATEKNPIDKWFTLELQLSKNLYDKQLFLLLDNATNVKSSPLPQNILVESAQTKMNNKDFMGAINDCDAAINIDREHARAYVIRGNAKVNVNNLDGAISDLGMAIKLQNDNPVLYLYRSLAYERQGKYEEALSDCDSMINMQPIEDSFFLQRGFVKDLMQDFAGAIADYKQASTLLLHEDSNIHFYIGVARIKLGNIRAAISDFDRAIEIEPTVAPYFYFRARAKELLGDAKGSISDYDRANLLEQDELY